MGIDAGIGEAALADAAVKGGTDAAEGAAGGGGLLEGLGSLFGLGGGAAAADAGAAGLSDFAGAAGLSDLAGGAGAADAGLGAGDLAFLGGGDAASLGAAGSAADAAAGAGAGAGAFDLGGSSLFDAGLGGAGAAAADASTLPSWLTGAAFDSGGGVAGPSVFSDVTASGALGPTTVFEGGGPGASLGGGAAFTPGAGIQGADLGSLDPTASALTSASEEGALPVNAQYTAGAETPTPMARPMGAGPSAADLAASEAGGATPATATTATTPATTATTPAAKAAASGGSQFLGMDVGKPNLFGVGGALLSGGLLANNLLSKNTVPGQSQVNALNSTIPQIQSTIDNVNKTAADLRASTQPLTADAQAMMSYTSKGTLPPAQQAQVTAGVQAAKAQAASIMANHGLSADPMQNAQLKQQFDTIDSQAIQLQGQLASQLYDSGLKAQGAANDTQRVAAGLQQTGLNAVGLSSNTYLALQKIYADQDTKQQAAIQNFAGALGKISGGGTTIKIGS